MGARELLNDLAGEGFCVAAEGDRLVIRPGSKLTDTMREALHNAKPELLALLSLSAERRARLLRWGWSEHDAGELVARLERRDAGDDDRVSCADCAHYRPGRCGNHRSAGLHGSEVGRDLVAMLQLCPGFQSGG